MKIGDFLAMKASHATSKKATKVSGYVDTPIAKKCGTCKHLSADRKHCNQAVVLHDPEIKTDPATKTKLVCADNGCCNEWET
jgi:hypothetical protein